MFWQSLESLNSAFSFSKIGCHTNIKVPSLLNCLLLAGAENIGFITLLKILVQSASSGIWTRKGECISFDVNHYASMINNTVIMS